MVHIETYWLIIAYEVQFSIEYYIVFNRTPCDPIGYDTHRRGSDNGRLANASRA